MTGFLDQQKNGFWSQRKRPKITAVCHCWLGCLGNIHCSDVKEQASHYHQDCQRRLLKGGKFKPKPQSMGKSWKRWEEGRC